MKNKKKFKLTITLEYTADPQYYYTDNVEKMIAIDTGNFYDVDAVCTMLENAEYNINIENLGDIEE